MPSLSHKRGTRAQIDAAASANALKTGEVYLITDEARLTVGTSVNAHAAAAKQGEGGGGVDPWVWQKLAADVANSNITLAPVTGLSFTAVANTTYLVDLIGTFQAAAATTGIAVALDIPSGSISGFTLASTSTAGAVVMVEQLTDNTTNGVTPGVRNAATNTVLTSRFVVMVGATGGAVQLQFRSEVAASAVTMKAGLTVMGYRVI